MSVTQCTATKYIDNLTPIPWPENAPEDSLSKEFKTYNKDYLTNIFGKQYDFQEFYAYRIFANWILLEDAKYDTLFIDENSRPVFLDFDYAFSGSQFDRLWEPHSVGAIGSFAAFCEGILTDSTKYNQYINQILGINKDKYVKILNELPECWAIPDSFIDRLTKIIFDQRERFIQLFKIYIRSEEEND